MAVGRWRAPHTRALPLAVVGVVVTAGLAGCGLQAPSSAAAPRASVPVGPAISAIEVVPGASTAVTVSWRTDAASTGGVQLGTTAYYGQSVPDPARSTRHSVSIRGLLDNRTYHFSVTATDGSGHVSHSPDSTFTTGAPTIDVWYGKRQVFGTHGRTEKWVNVLGTVSDADGVASLSYTLNDGASRALSIGPDHRRLQSRGDFNADIAWSSLRPGDNDVLLRAADTLGNVAFTTVTVTLAEGAERLPPYTITWSRTAPLESQAQVVDGLWAVDSTGLRIRRPGYDRLVDVGDASLRDFDVSVPVTVHGFAPGANSPLSNEPLVGLGLRWPGHSSKDDAQPAWGWYPTGALAWVRWYARPQAQLRGNNDTPVSSRDVAVVTGATYMLEARAETQASGATDYSFRTWPAGGAWPAGWQQHITATSGPQAGSVVLIAHQVDVTFGPVTVTPAP